MLDVLDAAYWDPVARRACFFAGARVVAYELGKGVVANVRIADAYPDLPAAFHAGIDAVVWDPGLRKPVFLRGDRCDDNVLLRERWRLPPELAGGVDTAFYCRRRDRTYFFLGDRFCEDGGSLRPLADGWWLGDFGGGHFDAVMSAPRGTYFFRGRLYGRYDGDLDPLYPARLGSPYGRGLPAGKGGGWLGLSSLVAGPLVGPVTPTGATLWVWTLDRGIADALRVRVADGVRTPVVRDLVAAELRPVVDAIAAGSQIVALDIADLPPASDVAAELLLGDRVLDAVVFRTARPPSATGRVELVAGSCADTVEHRDAPVFHRMAERRADVTVLLGDNCYYVNHFGSSSNSIFRGGFLHADWDDPRRMLLRQLAARNHPHFTAAARAASFRATWDDHDFGYNNSSGHDTTRWAGRDMSSAIHRAMWPAPYVAERAVYQSFRTGPVEVFVTDNRYDKDARVPEMLGETQLAWLEAGLAASDAPVVVVALGSQLLYRDRHESFRADAPRERERILAAAERVRGRVLLLSGDVHYSELVRWPPEGELKLLELTASSLRTGERCDLPDWPPGARLWAVQADTFATILVDTAVDAIVLEIRDDAGALRASTRWSIADGSVHSTSSPSTNPP